MVNYGTQIEYFKTVDSTNDLLKELAIKGENEGKVIVAEEQLKGRGRLNRSFYSPSNSGLYMSILLRPHMSAEQSTLITPAAAVATSKAIEEITKVKSEIKWVNDIFCHHKKVCGILTEAAFINNELDYAILGIGLNIASPEHGFPDEIKDVAGAILPTNQVTPEIKNQLAQRIVNNFWNYYKELQKKTFLQEYKNRSFVIGRPITIHRGKVIENAIALDIDDLCRLKVEYPDGTIDYLCSGEISIRTQ